MTSAKDQFAVSFDVSRETLERLEIYHALLAKWTVRINLVSKTSFADAWSRHFADSAQLWPLAADARTWTDIGSGAGFPGLVIAILGAPSLTVTLVESDQRKAAFLATVAQACGVPVTIRAERIESSVLDRAEVLSARALAPLNTLLAYAEKLRKPEGICLFLKGETVHKEIDEAARRWQFEYRVHPSRTDPKAAIVEIGAFTRV